MFADRTTGHPPQGAISKQHITSVINTAFYLLYRYVLFRVRYKSGSDLSRLSNQQSQ